jgi:adenosine/AMP kinase
MVEYLRLIKLLCIEAVYYSDPTYKVIMNIDEVDLVFPDDCNVVLGYSHFIKTIEDLAEIVTTSVPQCEFGIGFSEASGKRLIRTEGNSDELITLASENLKRIASGHTFLIILRRAYPINVLNAVKLCQEVGYVMAATSNPLTVLVARNRRGGGIIGVIDGYSPLGVEDKASRSERINFLRNIGYKKGP